MYPRLASPNDILHSPYGILHRNWWLHLKIRKSNTQKIGIYNGSIKAIRFGKPGPPSCLQESPGTDNGCFLQAGHVQACLAQTSLLSIVLLTLRLLVDIYLNTIQTVYKCLFLEAQLPKDIVLLTVVGWVGFFTDIYHVLRTGPDIQPLT